MIHRFIAFFGVFILTSVSSLHTVFMTASPRSSEQQQSENNGGPHIVPGIRKTIEGQRLQSFVLGSVSQPFVQDVLMSENFEGSFPVVPWQVEDYSLGGEYLVGKRTCRPHTGEYAGWTVGAGANGSLLTCLDEYPNDVNTWAIYGPFSLSTATSAQVTFYLWGSAEWESSCSYDGLFVGASTDGILFDGNLFCGNWKEGTETNNYHKVDLNLSDFAGESEVYLAFNFYSDSTETDTGFHIDDISVVTDTGSITPPPTTPPPATTPPATTPTPPSGLKVVHLPLIIRDYPPQPTPTPVPTLTPTQGQPSPTSGIRNLVSNGGFESGSGGWADSWFTNGGSRQSVLCRTGTYCMQICGQFANVNQCSPGFYQYITIPSDVVSLNLKFYWRGYPYVSTSTNQMYAKIFDGTTTYFTSSRLNSKGNLGYQMYSFVLDSYTVDSLRGKTIQLGFYDDKFYMAQIYYLVDDVELTATR